MIPRQMEGKTPEVTKRCPRAEEARKAWPGFLCKEGTTVSADKMKREPREPETEVKDRRRSLRRPEAGPSCSSSCSSKEELYEEEFDDDDKTDIIMIMKDHMEVIV